MKLRSSLFLLTLLVAFGVTPASAYTVSSWVSDFDGNGYVGSSDSLSFTHRFTPRHSGPLVVTNVSIKMAVLDDEWDWAGECFEASIGDDVFDRGQATINIFGEDVTSLANIRSWGDLLRVNVASTQGDFRVFKSVATFTYRVGEPIQTEPGTAVPEPGAALAFSVGGLLVAAATRRRR